jgi:hypothetical protein
VASLRENKNGVCSQAVSYRWNQFCLDISPKQWNQNVLPATKIMDNNRIMTT